MVNHNDELTSLTSGLLPNNEYLAVSRFTTHYDNSEGFLNGLLIVGIYPIANGLMTFYYAARAVWAALRAVGNLLILKPHHAADALGDVCFHTTLTVCLAVMAPIHAITYTIELLTRTISSWFTGQESLDNLSKLTLASKFIAETDAQGILLPSSTYFRGSRFFSSYKDAVSLIGQAVSPISSFTVTALNSLSQAFKALTSALELIINLAICKPKHALENLRDLSVHTSLTIALAIMAPINAIVEGIAFITRLGTTWVDACIDSESEEESSSQTSFTYK